MYITAPTLDDLLRRVFERLLNTRARVRPSRGETSEVTGILLKIANPRARLSRTETKGTIFSCLGELLWYLAGTKNLNFITYYLRRYDEDSEDGRTIYGGYGPRLFAMDGKIDQISSVLSLLQTRPDSRRAVIQLFTAKDIADRHRKEVPCTCTLQFMIRKRRLHMLTNMRSNDAFLGLPHDIFAFTMLQEIMARSLDVELGWYKHFVGSLHLYEWDFTKARKFLKEGWQATVAMPPMPVGDPWDSIRAVLELESAIRQGKRRDAAEIKLNAYWADLVRLLQIYRHVKRNEPQNIPRILRGMSSSVYNTYIRKRQKSTAVPALPEQMRLQDLR
jgi:thymidylate synthase